MKILITSDIHGNTNALNKIKESYDIHIDAGDSVIPEHILSIQDIISVRGNCDYYSTLPTERLLTYDDKTFLVIHGHQLDVKYGMSKLIEYAKQKQVNYCIYGHTHMQQLTTIDDIVFINPGAVMNKPIEYAIYDNGHIELRKV